MHVLYKQIFSEYLTSHIASKINPRVRVNYHIHYLAHVHTGNKFRVVFDASRNYGRYSLNSQMLIGPDVYNNQVGVELSSQEKPYLVQCDIKGKYHQALVSPTDRD